jgi:hypothetical protein
MTKRMGQRAIRVVYDRNYEKYGNYVPTILPLPLRYDAFLYTDKPLRFTLLLSQSLKLIMIFPSTVMTRPKIIP